jgi:hypothetical protein
MGGGGFSKAAKASAANAADAAEEARKQTAILEQQRLAAEAEADRLIAQRNEEMALIRRRNRGRLSLLGTEGGELGVLG